MGTGLVGLQAIAGLVDSPAAAAAAAAVVVVVVVVVAVADTAAPAAAGCRMRTEPAVREELE